MDDKRSNDRVSFKGRVHIIDDAGRVVSSTARLKNVSPSGFSLISEDRLRPACDYRFKIFLNIEETLEVRGRILYVKTESVYTLAGVKIGSVKLADRSRLNRFLSSQSMAIRTRFFAYSLVAGASAAALAKMMGMQLPGVITAGFGVAIVSFLWQPW